MSRHPPTAAVRESFGQAQEQAAAMVAGPPTPWNEASRAPRGSARWLGIAAMSVVAAGVTGWFAADWLGGPPRANPSTLPKEPIAAVPALPPVQTAMVPQAPVVQTALPAALAVTRQAGLIRIEATNASMADAVRALAQATRTHIQGGEALAVLTAPVSLHWQGTDVATAWDALLGRFASIGVSCNGAGCELWIVGVTPPPVSTTRAASAMPGPGAAVAEQPVAEAAQPPRPAPRVEPPPAAADENTETN